MRLKSWLIAINTALMAIVFAWAEESSGQYQGSAFDYGRTTTFKGRDGHFQGSSITHGNKHRRAIHSQANDGC